MSSSIPVAPPPTPVSMSQVERVGNIFAAPSRTFDEIASGLKSWWLPFLLMCLVSFALFGAITAKVGWHQVAQNAMRLNPAAMEKMEQAQPEQRAQIEKVTQYSMEVSFALSPILVLLHALVVAAVLMAAVNFLFGGKATFGASFSVTLYAMLPSVLSTLMAAAVAWFGTPESFNIQNMAPVSLGAFLNPSETAAWLYRLATSLDAIMIWCMVLLAIGFSRIARIKASSAAIAVFGGWGLYVLFNVAVAAARG